MNQGCVGWVTVEGGSKEARAGCDIFDIRTDERSNMSGETHGLQHRGERTHAQLRGIPRIAGHVGLPISTNHVLPKSSCQRTPELQDPPDKISARVL